ncbi:MAG: response regulator transcription factor [Dehalococcoidia bacterium]|nr:response regulator transcription factor [Dehalococcoidia bacterium]
MKILLTEDDVDLSDVTAFALRRQGFSVILAFSGAQALQHHKDERPDVVLLDLALPEPNGIDVLRKIREYADTPVIVVTGRGDEAAMVEAFSAGADDYVVKPFSFRQLVLRVNAVARRVASHVASSELVLGGLRINPDTWSVTYEDGLLNLTRIEFRILYCLASHFGRVTPTDRLLRYVWSDEGGDSNVLKTHLSHIRQKLAANGIELSITAVPNVGYILRGDEEAEPPLAVSGGARSNAS